MAQAASAIVTVACKLPNGMRLRIGDHREVSKVILGVTRTYKEWVPYPKEFVIKGPRRRSEVDVIPPAMEGGYVLTPGVDAEFMRKFMEDNASADYVVNGVIKVIQRPDDAKAVLRDGPGQGTPTGLEPMAQDGDARARKVTRRIEND